MCACRLEEMQQTSSGSATFYGDLEEYLSEVEKRTQSTVDNDDVYAQLSQKEKDLILAAELGKALLEKNEELSRANERLTEDYSRKLEVLEQEKHGLRRKLDSLEGEYDSRVVELQSDLTQMRKELSEQQTFYKRSEKEKSQLLEELTEQNHRLTAQLKQMAKSEEQLQSQLQSLREQFNVRRSNLHDHVSQLEGLREEINLLTERKEELERRIQALADERETLSLSLEESGDRIMMLEKRTKEQDQQIRNQNRDLSDLRETNGQLQDKLEVIMRRSSSPSFCQPSLYNEIEMSSQSSIEDELRSLNGSQGGRSMPNSHAGSSMGFHGDLGEEQDIECDDDNLMPYSGLDPGEMEDIWKLRQELVAIYYQLRRQCEDLRRRRDTSSADSGVPASPDEIQANHIRVGMLTTILKELRCLIEEAILNDSELPCVACQSIAEDRELMQKMQKEVQEKSEEIKKKAEELSDLTTKLTIQETELAAIKEERDQLRLDMDNSNLAKDEIVKKAWDVRDQAVARKNAVEIELAKTRIDVMLVNSQLMEVVQQKVELSQQLEQWQVDMQVLLDDQVKKMLKNQEQEDKKTRKQPAKRVATKGKLFGLWR